MQCTTDRSIRVALRDSALKPYINDENSLVVEEFGLAHGDSRIDVAVVNGHFHGYEIKSDADNLERLPHQVESYGKVFDFLWIVVGKRHLEKVLETIPDFWGVFVAGKDSDITSVSTRCYRPAQHNCHQDPISIAQLLWKNEALAILNEINSCKGYKNKPIAVLYKHLAELLPIEILAKKVREKIKSRPAWRAGEPQIQYADSRRSGPKALDSRAKNLALFLSR